MRFLISRSDNHDSVDAPRLTNQRIMSTRTISSPKIDSTKSLIFNKLSADENAIDNDFTTR